VTDLPLSGRIVQLLVIARRFRCDAVLCGRQIFTERFAEEVLAPSARRTARKESIVRAAITSPWSNGQTEGQITRLKLVRRQMYGRGNIDLLQARLIGAE
jgi:transposase